MPYVNIAFILGLSVPLDIGWQLELAFPRYACMTCSICHQDIFGILSSASRFSGAHQVTMTCHSCLIQSLVADVDHVDTTNTPSNIQPPCGYCNNMQTCMTMSHRFDVETSSFIPTIARIFPECYVNQIYDFLYSVPNVLNMYVQPAYCLECYRSVFIVRAINSFSISFLDFYVDKCDQHSRLECVTCTSVTECIHSWHTLEFDRIAAIRVMTFRDIPSVFAPINKPQYACVACRETLPSNFWVDGVHSRELARNCIVPCYTCQNVGVSACDCLNTIHLKSRTIRCPIVYTRGHINLTGDNGVGLYFKCVKCSTVDFVALPFIVFAGFTLVVNLCY